MFMRKLTSVFVLTSFLSTMVLPFPKAHAASVEGLPIPGAQVNLSSAYIPTNIIGLTVHPENPLKIDFIVNTGHSKLEGAPLKSEGRKLIEYFLATLAIPEQDQWVNLSPYEKNRIIPEELGQTVLGRDMLAEDYMLKQLSASLINPEQKLGKDFWNKVYAKSQQLFGTNKVPVNTFNKVWIMPDTAKVFARKNTVLLTQSHLKVMMEEDYLALKKNSVQSKTTVSSQIMRDVILPEIEHEINTGKNFANLRQIYNAMILATWYKSNLKDALLNQVYANQKKVAGVDVADKTIKDKIYHQYVAAYKKGVMNFIKEDKDSSSQKTTPRKYFSGGLLPPSPAMIGKDNEVAVRWFVDTTVGENRYLTTDLRPASKGMVSDSGRASEGLRKILKAQLDKIKAELLPLLADYNQVKSAGNDEARGLAEKKIDDLLNLSNVYKESDPNTLTLPPEGKVESLAAFKESSDFGKYRSKARKLLLDGKYVPMYLFAGAATRLKRGAMYPLDLWSVAQDLELEIPSEIFRLGMGPRQLIANYIKMKKLATEEGVDLKDLMSKQKAVMAVNADIVESSIADFVKNNFYGYQPQNVLWIEQPTYTGEEYDQEGNLKSAPNSARLPFGHGDNFMQLAQKGQVFRINEAGERIYVQDKDVLNVLSEDTYIASHRLNDLTKFSSQSVIDEDNLALGLFYHDQGYNLVGELVDNPTKQKGGNVVISPEKGKAFLLETSNAKGSSHLMELLNEAGQKGAPYNAFRLLYKVGTLKNELLENDHALPFNLRFKDGYFYLEAVTGDVTQMEKARAMFFTSGKTIRDMKELVHVPDAVEAMKEQDEEIVANNGLDFKGDAAMKTTREGGINLDSKELKLTAEGDKVDIRFNQAMLARFRRGDFTGIRPDITSVTRIPGLLPLLGLSTRKEDEAQA